MIPSKSPRGSDSPGICLAAGAAATTAAVLLGAALAVDAGRVLLIVAVVVAASSVRVSLAVGAGIGALAWGRYTGAPPFADHPMTGASVMADLLFVLLTVAFFVVAALVLKGVERL